MNSSEVLRMSALVSQIIAGVTAPLIVALIYQLIKAKKHDKVDHSKLKNGLRSLLKSQIIQMYNEGINSAGLTSHEKEIIHELHENYKELGGNGFIDNIMLKVDDM